MLDDTNPDDLPAIRGEEAPDFNPELETLSGDIRDWLLGRLRTQQRPWGGLSEAEQIDLANSADLAAREVIRKMARAMNAQKWPHTVVELGEVKIGGTKGIEAKICCANIEHNRTVLGEHVGQMVQIVMANSDVFMGERAPVDIDKDQPNLELDGDGEGFDGGDE
jgi:hypothetical protein